MADFFGAEVKGARNLRRTFDRMAQGAQRKALRPAVREGTEMVRREVLRNINGRVVQRRRGILYGAFADTGIRLTNARGGGVRGSIPFPTRDQLAIESDDPYFWPAAVEYGHPGAPAHPYLRPAIDENERRIRQRMGERIAKGVVELATQDGTFKRGT